MNMAKNTILFNDNIYCININIVSENVFLYSFFVQYIRVVVFVTKTTTIKNVLNYLI